MKSFKETTQWGRLLLLLPLLPLLLLMGTSCEDIPDDLCNPNVLDEEEFELQIQDALDGNYMGYSYVIVRDGNLVTFGADGKGRNNADGDKDMSAFNRMHIASASKFLTTIAVLHVLDLKGKTVNEKISDYLPNDWSQGPGINDLTFLDLIAQQSGLNMVGTQSFNATRFDSLKAYIAAGATNPKVKNYTNTHHGLCRILLPRLWNKYKPADGIVDEDFTTSVYIKCLQELLFDKINLSNLVCTPPNNNPNLAYASFNDTGNGLGGTSDFSNVSGGLGWHMSAMELAAFWAFSWYSNELIDQDARDIMMDNRAGLWNTIDGARGTYFCKLGRWNYLAGGDTSFNTVVVHYPNNYDLIIITNSRHNSGTSLRTIVRNVYEASFGCF